MAMSKKTKLYPVGWKFSDSFPPNGDCTKEKMKFFKANHTGWYVYKGVHSDHVPKRFKGRSPNPNGMKGRKNEGR